MKHKSAIFAVALSCFIYYSDRLYFFVLRVYVLVSKAVSSRLMSLKKQRTSSVTGSRLTTKTDSSFYLALFALLIHQLSLRLELGELLFQVVIDGFFSDLVLTCFTNGINNVVSLTSAY